jgi:hypothetical protein
VIFCWGSVTKVTVNKSEVIRIPGPLVADVKAAIDIYRHAQDVDAARAHFRRTMGQALAQGVQ